MRSILLVEDHDDSGHILAKMLGREFDVRWVKNEPDAREAAKTHIYDLIISDIGLGRGGCGLNLMRCLRASGCTSPAIALSGYGMNEDLMASQSAGFDRHVLKPVDYVGLLAEINRLLATRRSDEASQSQSSAVGESTEVGSATGPRVYADERKAAG